MGFSELINSIVSYAQNHTVIAIVLVLGLLFLMVRKPKLFFSSLFLALFLVGLYYVISNLAGAGSEQKKRMIPQEERQTESDR
jgi:galactitol-specific phosphotransferase system IIC component